MWNSPHPIRDPFSAKQTIFGVYKQSQKFRFREQFVRFTHLLKGHMHMHAEHMCVCMCGVRELLRDMSEIYHIFDGGGLVALIG